MSPDFYLVLSEGNSKSFLKDVEYVQCGFFFFQGINSNLCVGSLNRCIMTDKQVSSFIFMPFSFECQSFWFKLYKKCSSASVTADGAEVLI